MGLCPRPGRCGLSDELACAGRACLDGAYNRAFAVGVTSFRHWARVVTDWVVSAPASAAGGMGELAHDSALWCGALSHHRLDQWHTGRRTHGWLLAVRLGCNRFASRWSRRTDRARRSASGQTLPAARQT